MPKGTLMDLFAPASAGTLEEWALAGNEAMLDGLVYVGEGLDGLEEAAEAIDALPPTNLRLFPGGVISGGTWRLLILLPREKLPTAREQISEFTDPVSIAEAVSALGGCAIPTCTRQLDDGSPHQQLSTPPHSSPVGWLTVTVGGSILGTDLSIEDCFAAGRVVLGGTGPFGSLSHAGVLATHLPSALEDLKTLIAELVQGHGTAVERLNSTGKRPVSEPKTGKRRRRRRRRGKKSDQETSEGEAPSGDGASD